jgi:hypothetical protein
MWLVAVLVGWAGPATASGLRLAAAPVPPTQEIEVLDPGVDPTGKPRAVLAPGPGGGLAIDVPPTVLVHRFYPTGDRTFQGPMIPGGPVIVAVNHPRTLERVYVPVTLPPGAPQVTYRGESIRYDYGPQSVILKFGLCGKPTVHYPQSTVIGYRASEAASGLVSTSRSLVSRSGLTDGWSRFAQGTKRFFGYGADAMNSAGQAVVGPVARGFRNLAGIPEPADALPATGFQRPALAPDPDFTFVPRR